MRHVLPLLGGFDGDLVTAGVGIGDDEAVGLVSGDLGVVTGHGHFINPVFEGGAVGLELQDLPADLPVVAGVGGLGFGCLGRSAGELELDRLRGGLVLRHVLPLLLGGHDDGNIVVHQNLVAVPNGDGDLHALRQGADPLGVGIGRVQIRPVGGAGSDGGQCMPDGHHAGLGIGHLGGAADQVVMDAVGQALEGVGQGQDYAPLNAVGHGVCSGIIIGETGPGHILIADSCFRGVIGQGGGIDGLGVVRAAKGDLMHAQTMERLLPVSASGQGDVAEGGADDGIPRDFNSHISPQLADIFAVAFPDLLYGHADAGAAVVQFQGQAVIRQHIAADGGGFLILGVAGVLLPGGGDKGADGAAKRTVVIHHVDVGARTFRVFHIVFDMVPGEGRIRYIVEGEHVVFRVVAHLLGNLFDEGRVARDVCGLHGDNSVNVRLMVFRITDGVVRDLVNEMDDIASPFEWYVVEDDFVATGGQGQAFGGRVHQHVADEGTGLRYGVPHAEAAAGDRRNYVRGGAFLVVMHRVGDVGIRRPGGDDVGVLEDAVFKHIGHQVGRAAGDQAPAPEDEAGANRVRRLRGVVAPQHRLGFPILCAVIFGEEADVVTGRHPLGKDGKVAVGHFFVGEVKGVGIRRLGPFVPAAKGVGNTVHRLGVGVVGVAAGQGILKHDVGDSGLGRPAGGVEGERVAKAVVEEIVGIALTVLSDVDGSCNLFRS